MPQIKQETTYFGGKQFIMRVRCGKDGEFRINLPKYSVEALGTDEVVSDTMAKAISRFNALRLQYSGSLTKVKRVICYTFSINDKTDSYCDPDGDDDMSFSPGCGVVLAVVNCVRTDHRDADGKHLRFSYKDGPTPEQPYPAEFQHCRFGRDYGRDYEKID